MNGYHPEACAFRHQDQLLVVGDEILRRVPEQEVVPRQKVDGEMWLAENDIDLKRIKKALK